MSYSDSFPATRPVFQFNADAGRVSPNMTFSRADSPIDATKAAASAVHFWSNEKHLSSENLLTYSNPNDAVWTEGGSSVTLNQAASPSGTTTASLITEDSSTGLHRTLLSTPVNSGDSLTVVGYLKANGRTIVQVGQTGTYGTSIWVEFDLSGSGTATTREGSPTGVTIAQVGSTAWYKVSYSSTTSSSGTHYTQIKLCDAANSDTYTGDNSSGVYAWGFNLSTTGQLVHEGTSGQRTRSYAPKLKSVATAGAARFEYDPTDGQSAGTSLGILVEGQSTNLLNFSDDLTNSYWGKTQVSATGNVAVGPTGELSADLLVGNTTTNNHYLQRTVITTTASTTYTYSLYVKSAGVTKFSILMFQNGSPYTHFGNVSVDLSTSTIGTPSAGSGATIDPVGNGWFRVSVTGDAVSTSSSARLWLKDSAGNFTHTPNGYDGLLVAGQQFEAGQMSSLISTSGATATRAADSLSVATSEFGFAGGPVTGIVDAVNIGTANYPTFATITDSTGDQRVMVQGSATSSIVETYVKSDGTQVANPQATLNTTASKVGFRSDTNNFATVVNGGSVATDTSGPIPASASTLHIGQNHNSQYQVNGHIKRIALYNEALSDTNLQALTS